jgi:hypothetical protein
LPPPAKFERGDNSASAKQIPTADARTLTNDQREALQMLAESADGCTVPNLMTRGCGLGMLDGLVRDRLATAHSEREHGRRTKVVRLRITGAGRRVLAM